jgi:hypothetical protein
MREEILSKVFRCRVRVDGIQRMGVLSCFLQ